MSPLDENALNNAVRALSSVATAPPPDSGTLDNSSLGYQATADDWDRVKKYMEPAPDFSYGDSPSYFGGFMKTAFHGATSGMIGRDSTEAFWDPEAVTRFQVEHPYSAWLAQLLGSAPLYAIPFVGEDLAVGKLGLGLEAAKVLPGASRLAAYALNPETKPFAAAAAKEVARYLPFEAARVAGAALDMGQKGTVPTTLGQVAFELPLFAAVGGAAKALRASLPMGGVPLSNEAEIQKSFPFYNLDGSLQERLRQTTRVRELVREKAGLDPKDMGLLAGRAPEGAANFDDLVSGVQHNLRENILSEEPQAPNALIRQLADDEDRAGTKAINSLLRAGDTPNLSVRKLVSGEEGFGSQDEVNAAMNQLNLNDSNVHYVQYPRVIDVKTESGAKRVERVFNSSPFSKVGISGPGRGTWIAPEVDGGYVVVQRLEGEPSARIRRIARAAKTAEPDFSGRYAVFRTDRPLEFHPSARKMNDLLINMYRPLRPPPIEEAARSVPMMQWLFGIDKAVPKPEEVLGVPKSSMRQYIEGRMSPAVQETADALGRRGEVLAFEGRRVLAPGLWQWTTKRAMRIASIVRAAHNRLNAENEALFWGVKDPTKAKTLFGQLFEVPEFSKGINAAIDKAYAAPRGAAEITYGLEHQLSPAEMRAKGFHPDVVNFFSTQLPIDRKIFGESVSMQDLAREHGLLGTTKEFEPMDYHYGVNKTYRGDFRHEIFNENGTRVGAGSGYTAEQAKQQAQAIIAAAQATGASSTALKLGTHAQLAHDPVDKAIEQMLYTTGMDESIPGVQDVKRAKLALSINPPETQLNPRTEYLGGIGSVVPMTKKELKDIIQSNIIASRRNNLNIGLHLMLQDELGKLKTENPREFLDLIHRINQRAGKAALGPFSASVAKGVDAVLAPYMGKGSAEKIVTAVTSSMYTLTLSALNLGFAAVNAATPIMNSMGELAWMMTAPPEKVIGDYAMIHGIGPDKQLRTLWSLDPLKFTMRALHRMIKPTPEDIKFFERGITERIVEPAFAEHSTGAASLDLFGPRAKEQSWANWLFKMSNYPAIKSEEFSRGWSFMIGKIAAEDYWGMEGEKAFQMARQFTENTQYLYGAADRPRILTGPLGRGFGLFHNWGMHQIAMLARYQGEAFLNGNFAPLLWSGVGIGAVAGVGGLPWVKLADGVSRMAGGKGLQQNLYEAMGYEPGTPQAYFSDALFYGAPALLGISLQGSAAAEGADPMRDLGQLTSVAAWDRAQWIGDFLGSALDYATTTGQSPVKSREVMDKFVRATMPRTVYRFVSTTQDNALRSLKTQGRLLGPLTFSDRMAYSLGLTPLEVQKFYEVSGEAWNNAQERHALIDKLGAALTDARYNMDTGQQNIILREALRQGVLDSVVRSSAGRWDAQNRDQLDRQWKDASDRVLRRAIGAP